MSDYRARLMTEFSDLDLKIEKLKVFILSPQFETLSEIDRSDLKVQLGHMEGYFYILSRRCSRACN